MKLICWIASVAGILVASVFTIVSLAGCNTDSAKHKPITIGINPWPGYEFVRLAEQKGFYRDEGVDVRIVDLASTGDCRRAFERGQIDVFTGTVVELVLLHENSNRNAAAFYITDYSNGADMLIGNPKLADIRQLKGKSIGVEPSSLGLVGAHYALKSVGLGIADVTLKYFPYNELADALKRGDVDAVQTYPPASFKVLSDGNAKKLFDTSKIPGVIVDILAADTQLLEKRPNDLKKIIRAFVRAMKLLETEPEETLNAIATAEQITVAELKEAFAGMHLVTPGEQMEYFKEGGKLTDVITATTEVLNSTLGLKKQINLQALNTSIVINGIDRAE